MAKKTTARAPEVLDALEQDVELIKTDATVVEKFTAGVALFFRTARTMELGAKETLARAQKLTPPATMADDEGIQLFIKRAGAERKDALAHWDITAKVHAFHRRLCAARSRTEDPLEQAIARATRLHNDYVAAENKRVAAEQERVRIQAEQKAAADRQAELDALERAALDAEAKSTDLSEREQKFVERVVGGMAPMYAAQQAGYKDYMKQGDRLMAQLKIAAAIETRRTASAIRQQAAAVKEQPLDVQVEKVQANVSTAYGHDRTAKSGELLDEVALRDAVISGKYGIPPDVLMVNPVKLNEYARSLGELINRWPGARLKKSTSLV